VTEHIFRTTLPIMFCKVIFSKNHPSMKIPPLFSAVFIFQMFLLLFTTDWVGMHNTLYMELTENTPFLVRLQRNTSVPWTNWIESNRWSSSFQATSWKSNRWRSRNYSPLVPPLSSSKLFLVSSLCAREGSGNQTPYPHLCLFCLLIFFSPQSNILPEETFRCPFKYGTLIS
jgi:hypothetical protein